MVLDYLSHIEVNKKQSLVQKTYANYNTEALNKGNSSQNGTSFPTTGNSKNVS